MIIGRTFTGTANLEDIFLSIFSSFLAWLQVKQHQELAQSYSIAAQELGLIIEQGRYIQKEEDFSAFVSDTKNAISREHILWVARKDRQDKTQNSFDK